MKRDLRSGLDALGGAPDAPDDPFRQQPRACSFFIIGSPAGPV